MPTAFLQGKSSDDSGRYASKTTEDVDPISVSVFLDQRQRRRSSINAALGQYWDTYMPVVMLRFEKNGQSV